MQLTASSELAITGHRIGLFPSQPRRRPVTSASLAARIESARPAQSDSIDMTDLLSTRSACWARERWLSSAHGAGMHECCIPALCLLYCPRLRSMKSHYNACSLQLTHPLLISERPCDSCASHGELVDTVSASGLSQVVETSCCCLRC